MSDNAQWDKALNRRDFLLTSGALASTFMLSSRHVKASTASEKQLNLAIIGVGEQGRVLVETMLRMPNVRIRAVADIWEYSRAYAIRVLSKYGHQSTGYEDF